MNIYIPHQWLLEHLETEADQKKIAECLSLCGPSVERIEEIEGEPVYDIEVTTNRVDMMSVRGIAREAATILPEFGIEAKLRTLDLDRSDMLNKSLLSSRTDLANAKSQTDTGSLPLLDLSIQNNPDLNHRILAIKLENVQLGPSPEWLQKRLMQVGQRPLNNVIDITNYVMWEIGHPIHAFDYDRLTSKKIIVRIAQAGESFTTLDNKTFTTAGGEVVYDDGSGTIIDLPGIMGTANTVVTNDTKNVLLWIEANDAQKIRFASMTHAIRSQAAVLNEKHVDPTLGLEAITKAAQLSQEIAQGAIASQLYDDYPNPPKIKQTELKQELLDAYMGLHVEPERVERILATLGCQVAYDSAARAYSLNPPTFRSKDLQIPQDYIEEVARIYGYHNLPSVVMPTAIPDKPDQHDFGLEYQIKSWLSGWGMLEVYTYSMVSEELARQSGVTLADHLEIKNPLTDEFVYMRQSLLPSLAEVARKNPLYAQGIFELQHMYARQNDQDLPTESMHLALVDSRQYAKVKGVVEALLEKLHIAHDFVPDPQASHPLFEDATVALIQSDQGVALGKIGKLNQAMGQHLFGATLDYHALKQVHHRYPHSLTLSSTPPIIEDLTFTLPEQTYLGVVSKTIQAVSPLIESVQIKDKYHRNVTYTVTYRNPHENLSNEMIEPIRKEVISAVSKQHSGSLVGEV